MWNTLNATDDATQDSMAETQRIVKNGSSSRTNGDKRSRLFSQNRPLARDTNHTMMPTEIGSLTRGEDRDDVIDVVVVV